MNSNASSDIQTIVTDVLNSRPYTHRQDVDMSVAAVITAQHDLRFLASTVGAVLAQRMLPGMIVIADCTGQIEQPMQMTFDVIHSSQDVLTEVPEAKTVRVILVGVKQAASFMDAVTRAMDQIGIDAGIRALWTLHDDSRPADDRCFETLLDAWRNTPTAALLGAKQLDWQVCMPGTMMSFPWWSTASLTRSNMTGVRMCCRSPYRARWCRWLRCVRSKGLTPGSAPSRNPRTCAAAYVLAVGVS